jgi:hypothetical protein
MNTRAHTQNRARTPANTCTHIHTSLSRSVTTTIRPSQTLRSARTEFVCGHATTAAPTRPLCCARAQQVVTQTLHPDVQQRMHGAKTTAGGGGRTTKMGGDVAGEGGGGLEGLRSRLATVPQPCPRSLHTPLPLACAPEEATVSECPVQWATPQGAGAHAHTTHETVSPPSPPGQAHAHIVQRGPWPRLHLAL